MLPLYLTWDAPTECPSYAEVVKELVLTRIPRRFGFDARRDVQVLTPMQRGAAGTIALNQSLQAALNPEGASFEYRGTTFRVGDKVMQLKNDYDREVYNGDLGEIASVDAEARELVVRFDQREVEAYFSDVKAGRKSLYDGNETLGFLALAWHVVGGPRATG